MKRSIVIGDIHGCAKTLRSLIEEYVRPEKEDNLYLLGDYVNKGPDTKGVIDYILELKQQDYLVECLRGNHDQMMMDAWKDDSVAKRWLEHGGDATLKSFGSEKLADVPMSYYFFLATTSFFADLDDFILVHAGFNFNAREIYEDFDAMLETRDMTVDMVKTEGKKIVHGHVPVELTQLTNMVKKDWNSLSIDTGCVYDSPSGMGYLTALVLETQELISVKNKDN